MNENNNLKDLIEEGDSTISEIKTYKKSKLIIWVVRWIITIALYVIFWHISWVKWTLLFSVPLGLYSLHMIIFGMEEVLTKFQELNDELKEVEEED